jgi:hypothetical protein
MLLDPTRLPRCRSHQKAPTISRPAQQRASGLSLKDLQFRHDDSSAEDTFIARALDLSLIASISL